MERINRWLLGLTAACAAGWGVQADDHMGVVTEVSQTVLSGYVDTSAIWGFGEGSSYYHGRTNDGDGYVDGFNLNVVQLSLSSPMEASEWAAGYQVDLWLGPDAHWLASFTSGSAGSDFGVKQAYVNLMAPVGNGLELKMGHFDTIIGYEVGSSPSNPNFSRSYGFYIEPFQHTGLLANYQLTEEFAISAGVANTYGFGINDREGDEGDKAWMAALGYQIPDDMGALSGGALYAGIVRGFVTGDDMEEKTSYYAGTTLPTPVEGLSVGASFDYAQNGMVPFMDDSNYDDMGMLRHPDVWGDAWALAGYLSYQMADGRTGLHARVDYIKADYPSVTDVTMTVDGVETTESMLMNDNISLLSVTGTLSYQLWDNVLSRVELRWDNALDEDILGFGEDMDEGDQVTLLLNVAYQF